MKYDVPPLSIMELTNIISESTLPFNVDICKIIWEYYKSKPSKQQYAKIDSIYTRYDKVVVYSYYYGVFGFHEGSCTHEKVRELTPKEKIASINNKYWELPQQFYQSFPS